MTPAPYSQTVYDELRRLAAGAVAAESPGQTLSATALVHEAWLKLAAAGPWADRGHFFRTAAGAMRRILIDRARAKGAKKRAAVRVELAVFPAPLRDAQLLALDGALSRLGDLKPDHARLLELRFFAGLTGDETAATLGVSPATADRMSRYACRGTPGPGWPWTSRPPHTALKRILEGIAPDSRLSRPGRVISSAPAVLTVAGGTLPPVCGFPHELRSITMRKILAGILSVALVSGVAFAAELKSGPQTGDKIPGPFHPLNVNGESAGKKACLVCKHGASPVVAIFARSAECEGVAKLIKQVDEITGKNTKCEMGSFAVFLTDDDKTEGKLKTMAEKASLKNLTLSIDNPQGPAKYNISKDADITVVMYNEHKVAANYAFKKGELKDSDIEAIVKDVAKIVPAK